MDVRYEIPIQWKSGSLELRFCRWSDLHAILRIGTHNLRNINNTEFFFLVYQIQFYEWIALFWYDWGLKSFVLVKEEEASYKELSYTHKKAMHI